MQIEEAIEDIKLSKNTFLFGGEQAIVNIKSIETLLNYIDTIDHELKIAVKQIKDFEKGIDRLKKQNEKKDKLIEEQTKANKELNKVLIHFKAVINEMAKYINNKDNGDIYDVVCIRECENNKCELSEGDNEYQELECIKEYFYKKVSDK